ncbi:iron-siderophore ABC transporter substrate-binding protein [Microcoleus sp. FACHB-1515]|uniref:ABC transporter substrate-binding protein n=2 Tax=Cyanophyceae TaxID=3028117 RepID=UPI0016880504|nr:iron-siderophore ABC transporter substrate-binding protein [Microcoleus sp. FACHB-1515]MBD2091484.1 iron-siderophore ABC transporter substrate-binding protein [Microcoleus sp. FACHB-1515]
MLAMLTFLLVASCGTNSIQPNQISAIYSSSPASECRLIQHAMGETCVPLNPQRVITIDPFSLENVFALGIQPVGVAVSSAWLEERTFLRDRLSGVEIVGNLNQPNLEKVLSLKPDLILGLVEDETIYSQLTRIAPTVSFDFQSSEQWKEILMHNAMSLGKTEVANQLIEAYGDRLKNFKAQISLRENFRLMTVSVLRVTNAGVSPYLSDTFCSNILQDAGLNLISEPEDWLVSLERISDLDADVIFVWSYGYQAAIAQTAQPILQLIRTNPLWQQLKAVQKEQIYVVPSYWIGSGILSANAVIDDLFEHLVKG